MRPVVGRRRLTLPIFGFSLVVLAFGLAALGTALALQQAEALTTRLTVDAHTRATQIARTAGDLFYYQINASLRGVAEQLFSHPNEPWSPPPDWPEWITALFVWNGTDLKPVYDPLGLQKATHALLDLRGDLEPIVYDAELTPRVELVYPLEGNPMIVGAILRSASGREIIAAALDPVRLRAELLDPLVRLEDGLEIVESEAESADWSQRLAGAMRFWSIQPSAAYAAEQRGIVVGQTAAHLGLTIVSLATMLAAMWFLARVAKREMSVSDMKSRFVADVSHELKTPLALIRLFGETLLDGRVPTEEKRREYYTIIVRESTRLTNLINNILDFARIEAGRKEYTLQPVDAGRIVRETFEAYRPELEYRGFAHHLKIQDNLPPIAADRDAVAQALVNLLGNAVKYSEDERYIGIEVKEDKRRDIRGVLISVEDHGIGIKPEDRAHIFDGFYRAQDGRVRQRSGTGLGLSVVKHIVDAHHGSMHVEPRLVKGTAFRMFFPAAKSEQGKPS